MANYDPVLDESKRFRKFRKCLIKMIPRLPNDRASMLQSASCSGRLGRNSSLFLHFSNAIVLGRDSSRDMVARHLEIVRPTDTNFTSNDNDD